MKLLFFIEFSDSKSFLISVLETLESDNEGIDCKFELSSKSVEKTLVCSSPSNPFAFVKSFDIFNINLFICSQLKRDFLFI